MKPSIQTFLAELYDIDPTLKDHEADLIPLLEQLLRHDPAQTPSQEFVAVLRMRLRERAATLSSPARAARWSKWLYAFGGALTAAVVLPLVYVAVNRPGLPALPAGDRTSSLFAYRVEDAAPRAFGPLGGAVAGSSVAMGKGGGGGGGPQATGDAKIALPPFVMTQYEYRYEGTIANLPEKTVDVYKRDPSSALLPLSSLAGRLNIGTLDLNSFAGMNVDSMTFAQDKPYGYQLSVSLREGTVNINAQWDQWPQSQCRTEDCWNAQRVTVDQIPGDDALIAIARDFAAAHGIDLSHYGAPVVDKMWKRDYERAADKNQAYVPEVQRVIFPLVIDGQTVYDQTGAPMGIGIGVHVREKRVQDVWGIADRTYLKSAYEAVTDPKTVTDYLAAMNPAPVGLPHGATITKATVVLGEPTVSFTVYYRSDAKGRGEELLIPSLVFPVKEVHGSDQPFYMPNVVVPLAKELLDQQLPGPPMPLERGPAVDGPPVSTGAATGSGVQE